MVDVKELPELHVAYLHVVGPYDRVGTAMARLLCWASSRGLGLAGPPLGIFYDDPVVVAPDQCRSDLCLPVAPHVTGEGEVAVKTIPATLAAVAIHRGPYGAYDATYQELYAWIDARGYRPAGPPREIYLSDPGRTPPDDLVTEICVPVEASTRRDRDDDIGVRDACCGETVPDGAGRLSCPAARTAGLMMPIPSSDAWEALALGPVRDVVEDDGLLNRAQAAALSQARDPVVTFGGAKALINAPRSQVRKRIWIVNGRRSSLGREWPTSSRGCHPP